MSEQVKILFRGQSTLQNKFVKCLIIFEKKLSRQVIRDILKVTKCEMIATIALLVLLAS